MKIQETTFNPYEEAVRLIQKKDPEALKELLRNNPRLLVLNLENCDNYKFNSEEATVLAEVLKTNTTITALHLEHNNIGDQGVKAIEEGMKTNITVTTLHLNDNNIERESLDLILGMVQENSSSPKQALARAVGYYLMGLLRAKIEL